MMEGKVKKQAGTLSECAYRTIKMNITHGKLHPGDILREERLAEELSIGRTPVRAALQRLVHEGLAQTDANKSVRVIHITGEDIVQITQVRRELEMLTIRLLREKLTAEDARRLRQLCDREGDITRQENIDYLALIDTDYEIHVTLARLTGNDFLLDTMERMKAKSSQYLVLSGTMDKYGVTGTREHDEIIGFLEREQFDYAEIAMRNHVTKIGDRILV